MNVGFAQICIAPEKQCKLAGYGRKREMQGVHDDLHARTICVGDDIDPLVIIQLDVLGVDNLYLDELYKRLAKVGVDKSNVLVVSAHTHSAFGGIYDTRHGMNAMLTDLLGEVDMGLLDMLVSKSVEAVIEAKADMRPSAIAMANSTISGVATNRHSPDMPADNSIFAVKIQREDGRKALIYNMCCHPTVMNADNLLMSADIPGAVNDMLKQDYDLIVFVNGAAGDMSTRFTRKESSFDECKRMAGIICQTIGDMKFVFVPLEQTGLEYKVVALKQAEADSLPNAEKKLAEARNKLDEAIAAGKDTTDIRLAIAFVEGAEMNMIRAKDMLGKEASSVDVKVGFLQINDRPVICVPLELYSVLALELRRKTGAEIFGYANSILGYMADTHSYETGDYEAESSIFTKSEGERFIAELVQMLS